jgi:diaminohydroxyphosphoribosylaminopyrimidine deaminase/5-amino-6-(5-phosphoribosylamino)uracil reductase
MASSAMDNQYMLRCVQLASNGRATCSPNPMVGAVIVHDGRIVGEGWHRKAGEPHAEPNAIESVRHRDVLTRSTLYVSLEPCSHFGRTPPCVERILQEGIPRVVIGTLDPFPKVAGRGVRRLMDAGVEVVVGVEEAACLALNASFFHFQTLHRPRIVLKWAQTADGYIDERRESHQPALGISTPITRLLTHKLRSECDAILVGTNTARMDNPSLNVRYWEGKNPLRMVLDRSEVLPQGLRLLDGTQDTIVWTEGESRHSGKTRWRHLSFGEGFLSDFMEELYRLGVQSLLVEGGARLHETFLRAGLWDEVHVEKSMQRIGEGVLAPDAAEYLPARCQRHSYGQGADRREVYTYQRISGV